MQSNGNPPEISETPRRHNLISLKEEGKRSLADALSPFRRPDLRNEPAGMTEAYASLLRLLGLLRAHVLTNRDEPSPIPQRNALPPILTEVMRYVDDNLTGFLTVEEIAGAAHISVPYLSRLFSSTIGVGLKKYVLIRRVGLAKRMLDEGCSVTETCFSCGWSDTSYFIRVFKAYTGVTPHKYGGK